MILRFPLVIDLPSGLIQSKCIASEHITSHERCEHGNRHIYVRRMKFESVIHLTFWGGSLYLTGILLHKFDHAYIRSFISGSTGIQGVGWESGTGLLVAIRMTGWRVWSRSGSGLAFSAVQHGLMYFWKVANMLDFFIIFVSRFSSHLSSCYVFLVVRCRFVKYEDCVLAMSTQYGQNHLRDSIMVRVSRQCVAEVFLEIIRRERFLVWCSTCLSIKLPIWILIPFYVCWDAA